MLNFRAVTCLTFPGCWLVEEYTFVINQFHVLVTPATPHIFVFTLKREQRALVVVERRRLPFSAVVTTDTPRDLYRISKLSGMDIGMAAFTCGRLRAEIDVG